MSMQTNLPGFPGASHIYHVGATGFYLEYADKLGLSTQQRTSLNEAEADQAEEIGADKRILARSPSTCLRCSAFFN
ncbi:hypothetical protein HNQ36_004994 [Afipia massiliensis]|uniref:Uncharacterized protein n=1 Tax=Afipia massiliensis TaxID=211460 RepID=A0A840N4J6_9BRAD|nr:hypothetical protein [Afipia massiliensis]MBB5054983.1 hypothetical protein [Afipia massiliensis]